MRIKGFVSVSALAGALAVAPQARAQDAAPIAQEQGSADGGLDADPTVTENTIVVFGTRLLGQVDAPQPPVLELDSEAIASYGTGSIAELLEAIAPQVGSARGRGGGGGPVILVNGARISSFRELRSYPPEAIEKVEVFPEEVAQRYGYSPDQRVVNFILKDNYSSREIEAEYEQPWDGGYSSQEVEGTYLMISGPSRLNFNLGWSNSSLLTEAERGLVSSVVPTVPGDPNPADYRSLISDSAGLEATANWTTRIDEAGNSLSLNATFERDNSLRLQGLDTVVLTGPAGPDQRSVTRIVNAEDPLSVNRRSETYALGSTLNLGLGEWNVTGTLDGSHATTRSQTDLRLDLSPLQAAARAGTLPLEAVLGGYADAGFDEAITKIDRAGALVTARGNPIYLPSGDVSVTFDTGYDWNRIQSRDTRNPGIETELTRGNVTAGVNVGVPLTSRDEDFLGAVGDISLNASAGLDHLSDFGTLYDWTLGFTWGLTDRLNVNATYIYRDSAPTLSQLGDPEILTPNVQLFDITRNETVEVSVLTGGNALLPSQTQKDWKIGLIWELPVLERSNLSIDYIRNHSDNVVTGFPVLTDEIEEAFPLRFRRDPATGRLLQIDQRPVTFAEQDVERLQFGLNLSGQIGSSEEEAGGGGGGGGGGAPGGFGGAGAGGAGRGSGAGGAAGAGGAFNPERFAAMRQLLCGEDGASIALRLARGETVTGPDGAAVTLPPMMLERLQSGGEPNPEQVERVRQQICSTDGPPPGAAQGQQGGGGQRGPGGGAGGGGGRGFGGGFGRGPGGGGGDGAGRWFFNLQYTLDLMNEVLVAPGGPLLDLLEGDALAGGGQPRHAASFRLGAFYKGFGTFLNGSYTGSSQLEGSGGPNSTDLTFGDYATIDIRTFVDLGQQQSVIEAVPLLDDTRITFSIDNIFDARQRVTDTAGVVPQGYQPFRLDPIGRSFEIEFRKLF